MININEYLNNLYTNDIIKESKESIVIKELSIKEYKILNPLWKEFVKDTANKTSFKYENKPFEIKINQLSKSKHGVIFVAYDKDKPIGYIMGTINDNNIQKVKHGGIAQLVVSKNYRGKGIAKNLWSNLNKWFDKYKTKIKWVTSLYNNKEAIGLYKSFGFKPEMLVMRQ